MARLLVTGGAGFIGSHFVRHRRATHPDEHLVVLDAVTYAGRLDNLTITSGWNFIQGDICDTHKVRSLIEDEAIDTIVHFAAETHVDRSINGPSAFVQTNIVGTNTLLEAARAAWLRPGTSGKPHLFHHISTDEVYGSLAPDAAPSREGDPYRPNSPYAASKAAADHLVRAAHRTFGLQTRITICPNNYGPRQYPEKLIPLFVGLILLGRPLPIYGDGLNRRDWLHVEDHVRGIGLALERGAAGETYHLGGGEPRTNLHLVEALCTAVDCLFARQPALVADFPDAPPAHGRPSNSLMSFVPDRPGHDRRYAIDGTMAAEALGFIPERRLAEGLEETVDWYAARPHMWRGTIRY